MYYHLTQFADKVREIEDRQRVFRDGEEQQNTKLVVVATKTGRLLCVTRVYTDGQGRLVIETE